jgi:hypothetical protein
MYHIVDCLAVSVDDVHQFVVGDEVRYVPKSDTHSLARLDPSKNGVSPEHPFRDAELEDVGPRPEADLLVGEVIDGVVEADDVLGFDLEVLKNKGLKVVK